MLKYRGRPTLKSFDQAIPSLAEILIRDIPGLAEIFFFSTSVAQKTLQCSFLIDDHKLSDDNITSDKTNNLSSPLL